MKKLFLASIIFLLLSFISTRAEPSLSRAIDIIRQKNVFCKNTSLEKTYTFSKEDFEKALGTSFDNIVIKSVPENCTLKFGVEEVTKGAVISKSEISALRCIPHQKDEDIDLTFNTSENFTETNYTFRLCPHEKDCVSAPQNHETFSAVSIYGTLPSENVKITENTKNGTLTVSRDGSFIYTPNANFSGKDTFSYQALTSCGATSPAEKVEIRVRRPYRNLYFSDMVSHPAHASAIKLFEKGALDTSLSQNTSPVFNPEESLSRALFTHWALTALGIETTEKNEYTKEVFADEQNYGRAIDTAINLGILRGEKKGEETLISPEKTITLAEASVILCRILAPVQEVFSENGTWYNGAMAFLENTVSLPSHLTPDTPLTRGDGALILGSLI